MSRIRDSALSVVVFLSVAAIAGAQSANPTPVAKIEVGAKYVGWGSNYSANTPFDGSEILTPLTVSVIPWTGGTLYAQTEFAHGDYTDSLTGTTKTNSLTNLSDTVVGLMANFKSFSVPSLLNVGVNIPTGDPTWETTQTNSIVPTEFIDSDYKGRGFGISALYGLSFPAGSEQYGLACGYLYSNAFPPYIGLPTQLKLGDSAFLSLNRVADHGNGQTDVVRLSAFYFVNNTQLDGAGFMQMGPNLNASYGWQNPKAFSFEAGVQYFMQAQLIANNQNVDILGTRFYATPSYAFGDFTLTGRAKYVLSNGTPGSNAFYFGGGWMAGLEPSYRMKLDNESALKFSASFDYIYVYNGGPDFSGNLQDVSYGRWTLGTDYEVNL